MSKSFKKLPGVLSLQRGTLVSDGLFFNLDAQGQKTPLHVLRHGIRGTQNVVDKKSDADASSVAGAKGREVSNIQQTDSAKLSPEAQALGVGFSVRFLSLDQAIFACAASKKDTLEEIQAFKAAFAEFIQRAKESQALDQLALRYARNVANARWLWRNRAIATAISTDVELPGKKTLRFASLDIPLNRFDAPMAEELELAQTIKAGMLGQRDAHIKVFAKITFDSAAPIEVFPSQNYLETKGRGFARSLYYVGDVPSEQDQHHNQWLGQAALRDQKLGNALRTIDTWYPDYAKRGVPIAVEPNGASLEAQMFFRSKKTSAFDILLQVETLDPLSDDGQFLLACIVRGGVYSGGSDGAGEA